MKGRPPPRSGESRLFDAAPTPAGGGFESGALPLAARMRPRTIDEIAGQRDLLEPGSLLRAMLEDGGLRSVLLFGPPGTGKTSIARLLAARADAEFIQLSAVTAGVADVRKALDEGRTRLHVSGRRTILFVDEVHRFSKTQQDALLPGVEDGSVVFVGATTENPFFSVIGPLLSRCVLLRLEPLSRDDLDAVVRRAVEDERGLAGRVVLGEDALPALLDRCDGDARVALGALEAAADLALARDATIRAGDVAAAMRQRTLRYDRAGDAHYDIASAFIKSMRGSDPDAALAWLARMLAAGEDPRFVARRMIIFASEDVGLADPDALPVAVAAAQAVEFVGMPEAQLNLAHAAVHLALAPKSNAVTRAIGAAGRALAERGAGAVPDHLRDASHPGTRAFGHGVGYKYPHDFPGNWVEQRYLPEGFESDRYWEPEPGVGPERPAPDERVGGDEAT